jgi:hypothetical protein
MYLYVSLIISSYIHFFRFAGALTEVQMRVHFVEHRAALHALLHEAQEGMAAVYGLYSGRMSPTLVNFTVLRDSHVEVSR